MTAHSRKVRRALFVGMAVVASATAASFVASPAATTRAKSTATKPKVTKPKPKRKATSATTTTKRFDARRVVLQGAERWTRTRELGHEAGSEGSSS